MGECASYLLVHHLSQKAIDVKSHKGSDKGRMRRGRTCYLRSLQAQNKRRLPPSPSSKVRQCAKQLGEAIRKIEWSSK